MHRFAIPYPNINPEIFGFDVFGMHLAVRWYALAYIVGIIIAWRLMRWIVTRESYPFKMITPEIIDDFITYGVIGVLVGGRLVYTLVYDWAYFSQNPIEIIMPPYSGMSFHGGFLGVILAVIFVAWKHRVPLRPFADLLALTAPFAIFLGRIANFINGELKGRIADPDLPWGIIYPAENFVRHPSQIYEALLEGLLLAAVLWAFYAAGYIRRAGTMTGIFFLGYGLARVLVENFREPDDQFFQSNPHGYVIAFGDYGLTMGQTLSIPMILIGLYFLFTAKPLPKEKSRKKNDAAQKA